LVGGRKASHVARAPSGRRRRGRSSRLVALVGIAFTLSAISSGAIAAETEPTVDETRLTTQVPTHGVGPKKPKPPKPSPTPSPTPEPSPSPSSEPSPEPSPSLSPTPQPSSSPTPTSSPTPDPAPTSPPRPPAPTDDGPSGSGGAPGGTDTSLRSDERPLNPYDGGQDPFGGSEPGEVAGFAGDGSESLFGTVASIIDELTTTGDRAIQAAEAPSTCPGSSCDSSTDATGTRALFIVLTCLAIAFAGALVIRARDRRPAIELSSHRP
jgi:outer membrane biosynthesis protein TonB